MDTATDGASADTSHPTNGSALQDSKGGDSKLRVNRRAVVTNAEILSDPDYSDEDAPPIEKIDADEGKSIFDLSLFLLTGGCCRLA